VTPGSLRKPAGAVVGGALVVTLTLAGDRAGSRPVSQLDGSGPCRGAGAPVLLPEVPEASGVALGRRNPRLLWMHNDSDGPYVLGYDLDGALRARVRVTGASVEDWEDLAIGPCPSGSCLYIADIGDNDADRPRITIYRAAEPGIADEETARSEAFHGVYPDGPRDAESVLVTRDGVVIVATKDRPSALYQFPRAPASGAVTVLERLLVFDESDARGKNARRRSRLTGGSVSRDGQWMALRSNTMLRFIRSRDILARRIDDMIEVDLTPIEEPQGEGVAFGDGDALYLVSEGGKAGRPGSLVRLTCQLPR
jgi:hypothetical protein